MSVLLWLTKFLLKVLKPFAKVAIIEALLGALGDVTGDGSLPFLNDETTEAETEVESESFAE